MSKPKQELVKLLRSGDNTKLIIQLNKLTDLDLSNCRLTHQSIITLATILLTTNTVKRINLKNCGITAQGASEIARALVFNTSLAELFLSNNPLGFAGAQILVRGLEYNNTLKILSLANTNVTLTGVKLLKKFFFSPNCAIQHLLASHRPSGKTSYFSWIHYQRTGETHQLCEGNLARVINPEFFTRGRK